MNDTPEYTKVESFVNSIIGEGTTLRGDFELNGLLRIDGVFHGKVRTSGKVLIGRNGNAECTIVAGTVVVGGKVKGEIIATERITLLSTGVMIGSIVTPRLIIEEGVVFNGKCEIVEDRDRLEKIKQDHLILPEKEKPARAHSAYAPQIDGFTAENGPGEGSRGEGSETETARRSFTAQQDSVSEDLASTVEQKVT
jgi:cytoskeletal protein CcmA (bactofilin family)